MIKKKLKDIANLINGYAFKSSEYIDSGIRVIRIANVQDGYISDESPCFYPLEFQNKLGEANLIEGDLLMSLTGNVGRVAILNKDMLPAGLNQRVECIREKSNISKKYLYNFFRSKKFYNDAINNATGCAQLNMSTKWLGDYLIPIYDEETTNQINNHLKSIDSMINIKSNQLLALDELIKSRFIGQEVYA